MDRVRQKVLLAEVSKLGKPGILDTMVEDINTMLVEDVRGSKACYHVEEGILVLVDKCWGRQGS